MKVPNVGKVIETLENVQKAPQQASRRIALKRGDQWLPAQVCTVTVSPHDARTYYHVVGTWGAEYVPISEGPALLRIEEVRS